MSLYPVQHVPTRQNLRNANGMTRDFGFQEFHTIDSVEWFDDFLGDTIHGAYATATNGTGADALAISATGISGEATIKNGTADDAYSGFALGLEWHGQLNCAMAVRLKTDDIAATKIEVGFTDATDDGGACNDLDGATFTATDCAVWAFDTDDSTDNWKLASTPDGGTTDTVTDTGFAPAADTYETLIVALEDTTAHFYRLDSNGYQTYSASQTTGPSKDVALTPWVFTQTREASDEKTVTVDFIKVWQRRTVN